MDWASVAGTILVILGSCSALAGIGFGLLPILPGPPMAMLGPVLVVAGFQVMDEPMSGWSWAMLAVVLLLGVLVTAIDLFSPVLGKKLGGTGRGAMVGAYFGLMIALLFSFHIGGIGAATSLFTAGLALVASAVAALLLLFPSVAMAVPWFDQGWAEQLVAAGFPAYWDWICNVRDKDEQRYLNLLHQGRAMALQREQVPELVEAWETRFLAQHHYRSLVTVWNADETNQTDAMRLQLISAAENLHLAALELYDARVVWSEARIAQLELRIADTETNYDLMARELVEKAIGPLEID